MVSKKYWKKRTESFLEMHKDLPSESSIEIEGYKFDVFPDVFSPLLSSDTSWFVKHLIPLVKNKSFLEIGTGSGVIGCLAKLHGARRVVVTDINPSATKNAIHNAKKHSLEMPVFLGNVFEPLPTDTKFDIIFWNHPFNHTDEESDQSDGLSYSVFDLSYNSLRKYFEGSRTYLEKNGVLLLGTGNIARLNMIKKIARENQFKMELLQKESVGISQLDSIKMDVRLYRFEDEQIVSNSIQSQ